MEINKVNLEKNEIKEQIDDDNYKNGLKRIDIRNKYPEDDISNIKFNKTTLKYRVLKSSIFFTILWLVLAFLCYLLIKSPKIDFKTTPGFTLIFAALICIMSAFQSFERYGGTFIIMDYEYMIVHNSFLNNLKVYYKDIQGTTYKNEIIGLITYKGKEYHVNLAHLNDEDERIFLELLKNRMDFVRGKIKE